MRRLVFTFFSSPAYFRAIIFITLQRSVGSVWKTFLMFFVFLSKVCSGLLPVRHRVWQLMRHSLGREISVTFSGTNWKTTNHNKNTYTYINDTCKVPAGAKMVGPPVDLCNLPMKELLVMNLHPWGRGATRPCHQAPCCLAAGRSTRTGGADLERFWVICVFGLVWDIEPYWEGGP